MSHTLHRIKSETGKYDDYVILIMPARGINNQNSVEVFRKYLDLLYPFHPVNMGGMKMGTLVTNTFEEIKANISPDAPMMHAVFRDRDTLIEAMKAIRDADYGYSVVVSGLVDDVDCCAKKAGIQRHSVDITLGTWGDTSKLPPEEILECADEGYSLGFRTIVMQVGEYSPYNYIRLYVIFFTCRHSLKPYYGLMQKNLIQHASQHVSVPFRFCGNLHRL